MADIAPREADPDAAALMALRVWQYKEGEMVSLMIHLGDRLGLYTALDGAGPVDASQLAERTGLHERWLLEWLRGQAAAGLLDTADGESFALSPEAAMVLADETDSLLFAAGAFRGGAAPPEVVDKLADAFSTGMGLAYDDLGTQAAHGVERSLGPWSRLALVPELIPRLDGMQQRLTDGIRVVDVGCGTGLALRTLAEAFPRSTFEGIDPSVEAITIARDATAASGLTNLTFRNEAAEDLPTTPTYELAITFDCLHDMTRPAEAAAAVHSALTPDGTWLVKEVRAGDTWEENQKNPVLAMMYGNSVSMCMSCGLSEPGGAGLGTLGLPPSRLEAMCADAGFRSMTPHDIGDPANMYYEIHR